MINPEAGEFEKVIVSHSFHTFKELLKGHIHSIDEIEERDECDIFITFFKSL